MKTAAFPDVDADPHWRTVTEAAPARTRIRAVAVALVIVFALLGARALQLALTGDPGKLSPAAIAAAPVVRADLTDRNGVLLATTIPSFTMIAEPTKVWDAPKVAARLTKMFPDLDRAALEKKLTDKSRNVIYLKRDLTPRQKAAVLELGLPGVSFENAERRVYPQGRLAAHLLGVVNAEKAGAAGIERGLDKRILGSDDPVRLSIDVRVQHALEAELAAAIAGAKAEGGAGIILDGRTGEVLGLASLPDYDPNDAPRGDDQRRLNRAVGAVYEMGSSLKPFTFAMGLEARVTAPGEIFNLSEPLPIDGYEIKDFHPLSAQTPMVQALAESSNIAAAQIALRVGGPRQKAALEKLGLYARPSIELPESARPLTPPRDSRLTTAVLGYGHGAAMSLTALAGAYTIFANDGARIAPTLVARERGDEIARTPVFSKETTGVVLSMMREVVKTGTGKRADVPGLEIAGKTGSAEKPRAGAYEPDKLFSSFAAVFPASEPRYVIVLALDEPRPVAEAGGLATGGAVAAPAVGRIAARIAPLLGVEPKGTRTSAGGESP